MAPEEHHRRSPARVALGVLGVLVGVFLIAPMLVVFPMGFTGVESFKFPPPSWSTRWYENFFSDPRWLDGLQASLQIAVLVTIVSVVLGTAAAFGLVRGSFRGRNLLRGFMIAPLVLPGVVLAIGVYALFLRWRIVGDTLGFVLAHTVLATPYVVVTVSASLQTFDRRLEAAAANLGASPWSTFRRVTLPLIRPGVLSGALFAFITSFDEVIISNFLSTPTMRTLPVQMYSSVTRDIDPTIAAASSMILSLTTALLLLAHLANRRNNRAA